MVVKIEGYLTQQKLQSALQQIIPSEDWLGAEVRVPDTRRRWDMMFRLQGHTYVVEFDGDAHYRDPLIIKGDREKDAKATELGYKSVRIPYWVQLTSETAKHFFDIDVEIAQNYPHGFHDKKAMLPASYCRLGHVRWYSERAGLPEAVRIQIDESLKAKAEEYGREYVYCI